MQQITSNYKIEQKVRESIKKLDETHWLRMLVFWGPGAILTKLATEFDAPAQLKLVSMAIFGFGILLYASWKLIMKKIIHQNDEEDTEVEIDTEVTNNTDTASQPLNSVHVKLMNELIFMCNGDAQNAIESISLEAQLNPQSTYLTAIEVAHRRKALSHPLEKN
jgi:hypothetical protein